MTVDKGIIEMLVIGTEMSIERWSFLPTQSEGCLDHRTLDSHLSGLGNMRR